MSYLDQRDKYLDMTKDAIQKLEDRVATIRRNALHRVLTDARHAGIDEVPRDEADRRAKELAGQWGKTDDILKGHVGDVNMFSQLATMYGIAVIGDTLEASWRSH